jgi:hypothetical protein
MISSLTLLRFRGEVDGGDLFGWEGDGIVSMDSCLGIPSRVVVFMLRVRGLDGSMVGVCYSGECE